MTQHPRLLGAWLGALNVVFAAFAVSVILERRTRAPQEARLAPATVHHVESSSARE